MRQEIKLTAQNDSAQVSLPFVADGLSIVNSSPFTLLIRVGNIDVPNDTNADFVVYAGSAISLPVSTREFGLTLLVPPQQTSLVGLPCTVRFSVGEPLASFGQTNWRSELNTIFLVDAPNPTETITIPTAGAAGLSIGVDLLTASAGDILVSVQTSFNGSNFKQIKRYRVGTIKSLSRVFPVTSPYIRIQITRTNTGATCSGIVSYSLLNFFAPTQIDYKSIIVSSAPQTILAGNTVGGVSTIGSQVVTRIFTSFKTPAPNSIFYITLTGVGDGLSGFLSITLTNAPPLGGTTRQEAGTGLTPHLIHRRLNEWAYEWYVEWHFGNDFNVNFTNVAGSPSDLTNVAWGYETRIET